MYDDNHLHSISSAYERYRYTRVNHFFLISALIQLCTWSISSTSSTLTDYNPHGRHYVISRTTGSYRQQYCITNHGIIDDDCLLDQRQIYQLVTGKVTAWSHRFLWHVASEILLDAMVLTFHNSVSYATNILCSTSSCWIQSITIFPLKLQNFFCKRIIMKIMKD